MRPLKFIFSRFFICVTMIAAFTVAIVFFSIYVHSLLPVAAAIALAYVLSVTAALILLLGGSPSEFKCGWLVIIVALPVAGAVLYFISYLSRTQRTERSLLLPETGCSGYEYFADGAEYLDRLIALVSSAKRCVFLEYYIISKGHIWSAMFRELKKALDRGVEIKIIYDGLGSALRAPKNDFKVLKRAGAEIKVFNKLLPLPVSRLNFRDHRKIGVIDGDAVFLGGVNIADEYANLSSPHGFWKDGGGVFYGKIVLVFAEVFKCAFYGNMCDCPRNIPETRDKLNLLPIADEPESRGGVCEDLLSQRISSAEKRVWIFTPYLCMGDKLADTLSFAARRGVDVKIIVPHIPDKKLTYAVTKAYCQKLASEGVQIFTYTPGFMHFKGVVCDDFAFLGSYNFDYRSMRLNYECGVLGGSELAYDMQRDFENCLAVSAPFEDKKPSVVSKLLRAFLYLFAPLT